MWSATPRPLKRPSPPLLATCLNSTYRARPYNERRQVPRASSKPQLWSKNIISFHIRSSTNTCIVTAKLSAPNQPSTCYFKMPQRFTAQTGMLLFAATIILAHKPTLIIRPGAILSQHHSNVYLITSHWKLLTELDFAQIVTHIRSLHKLAVHTQLVEKQAIERLYKRCPEHGLPHISFANNLSRSDTIIQQIDTLAGDILQTVQSFSSPNYINRERRALLPFVGSLLQKLFGTSTVRDTRNVKKLLARQQNFSDDLFHVQKYQTTLFNQTNILIKQQNSKFQELTIQLHNVETTINNVSRQTDNLLIAQIHSKINSARLYLELLLDEARNLHTLFLRTLDSLLQNRLTLEILPPRHLFQALEGIQNHLPHNLAVLPAFRGALFNLYRSTTMTVNALDSTVYIQITIPLLNKRHILDLFHATFLPHRFQTHQVTLFSQQPDTNLLVTKDRSYFTTLSDGAFHSQCTDFDTSLYCSLQTPLHALVSHSCLFDLLMERDITTSCSFQFNATFPPIFSFIEPDGWAFSLPQPTLATILCQQVTSVTTTQVHLNHVGILSLPPYCRLLTNNTQLLPSSSFTSKLGITKFSLPRIRRLPLNYSLPSFLANHLSVNNTNSISAALHNYTQLQPLDLSQLQTFADSLATDITLPTHSSILPHHLPHFIYTPILLLLVLVSFAFYCRSRPRPP